MELLAGRVTAHPATLSENSYSDYLLRPENPEQLASVLQPLPAFSHLS